MEVAGRQSEVVDRALKDGPQVVTRHGENAVVVVSYQEFAALRQEKAPDFREFLLSVPRVDWDFEREEHPQRDVDL
jgi:antitoxin Phd